MIILQATLRNSNDRIEEHGVVSPRRFFQVIPWTGRDGWRTSPGAQTVAVRVGSYTPAPDELCGS